MNYDKQITDDFFSAAPKRSKPSKGGRSEHLKIRITPEAKMKLQDIADKLECSKSDLIHKWINENHDEIFGEEE